MRLSYAKADERFLRAELLREQGREEMALRWYATCPDPQGYDLIYLAPSHLRRAEIHQRRGEREKAAEHYRHFVELWRDADPELQPLVEQPSLPLLAPTDHIAGHPGCSALARGERICRTSASRGLTQEG